MRRFGGIVVGAVVGVLLWAASQEANAFLFLLAGSLVGALAVGSRSKPDRAAAPPLPEVRQAAPPRTQESHESWTRRFLERAVRSGTIDDATFVRLDARLRSPVSVGATPPPQTPPTPPTPPTPVGPPLHHALQPLEPMPASRPARPIATPEPSPAAAWFERVRHAVVSDVAVHGLAYLGVLLVVAGTLGFFLFSFGELSTNVRPWAELAIPTVLLGSAAFLRRRGAPVVATALGVAGGVLLPVVLFASFVDGVPFPPEFHDAALGWAVIATSLGLALVYGVLGAIRRDTSVRYLVAPLCWTAAWGISLLLPDAPAEPLKEWTAAGFTFATVAVALTGVAVRFRPRSVFAEDARPTLIPGALITLGVALLLAGSEDWPWWVVVVAGLSSLVTSETVADRLGVRVTQAVQPLLLWLTVGGLYVGFDERVAGPALVAGSVALFEWQSLRRPGPMPAALNGLGAAAGLAIGLSVLETEPWTSVAAFTLVAMWAHVRRVVSAPGLDREPAPQLVAATAALAPVGAAVALVQAMPEDQAFVGLAVATLGIAAAVRVLRPADAFLARWLAGSAAALGLAAAIDPTLGHAPAAATLGLASTAVGLTTLPVAARAWLSSAGVAGAAWFTLLAAGSTGNDATLAMALGAATVVVLATWWPREVLAHVAAAAWVTATAATVAQIVPLVSGEASADGWIVTFAIAGWTVATAAATVAFESEGTGAGEPLRLVLRALEIEPAVHVIPIALVQVGLAGVVVAAWDASGAKPIRVVVVLSALAVLEAAATWTFRTRRIAVVTAGIGVFVLAVASAVAGVERSRLSVLTLALGIGAVAALAPQARFAPMTWTAWAASGALVVQTCRYLDVEPLDMPLGIALWAAVLALGALVADDLRSGRRAPGEFVRSPSLMPPAILGLAVFVPAIILCLTGSDLRIALCASAGAAVVATVAFLVHLGSVTIVSFALLTVAVGVSLPWSPADDPWLGVAWAAVLMGTGIILRAPSTGLPAERRWDLPAVAVAGVVLVLALGQAVIVDEVTITWTAAGALVIASAIALRSFEVATLGEALVVVGAIDAGHGWGALALAAASVVLAYTASRYGEEHVELRLVHQVVSAALAAGALVELRWFEDWSLVTLSGVALTLAAVATVAGLALQLRWSDRPWGVQAGLLMLAMQAVGSAAAVAVWPDRAPTVAALLVASGEAAAIGIALQRAQILMLTPVFACAAWLVAARDLLEGSPMWWAAPAGLALLAIAAIGRWDRRHMGQPAYQEGLAVLEYAGMAALLVPPLVETLSVAPIRGLIAVGIGILLAVWGLATKVRRRFFVGAGGVVTAVVLMLAGPVARLFPQIQGPTLWVLLALVGIVMIVVATSLERGRARLAAGLRRLDELLDEWE